MPVTLDAALRARALRLLARAPPHAAQDVADEWIARWRTGALRNSLAYLATLVQQAEAGRFHPELAGQERVRREEAIGTEHPAGASPPAQHAAREVRWIVEDLAQRLRCRP
ncbi:MAG: hypothetical protein ACREU7_07495 [Burkholderiales bacterium]